MANFQPCTKKDEDMEISRKMAPIFVGDEEHAVPDTRILELKHLLRPDEVASILRLSMSKVYELCVCGVLESVKIHRSTRIKAASVRRLIGV